MLQEIDHPMPQETICCDQEDLPDLTQQQIRQVYLVDQPENRELFLRLKKKTPARLGLGRAGARYRTQSMLRFRADHAAAQDSVFSIVEPDFYQSNGLQFVQTMCQDKDQYLTRPDLGRKFDEKNQAIIRQVCGTSPKVLLVIGDGLSSNAVKANSMDCAQAICQGMKNHGMDVKPSLFIQFARVGAMDHIGQLTGAELICMLVGGVGVMNILLVGVRERRREIGIMQSMGTTGGQICCLFLLEALIYAAIGGFLGILLGMGLTDAAGRSIGLHPQISLFDCAAVLMVAFLTGLGFGVAPAARASGMKPVDALRRP